MLNTKSGTEPRITPAIEHNLETCKKKEKNDIRVHNTWRESGEDEENVTEFGLVKPPMKQSEAIGISVECVYIPIISNIDVSKNTFDVRVDIDLMWDATVNDQKNFSEDPSNYNPEFVPGLVFANFLTMNTDKLIPLEGNVKYQIRNGTQNYIRHRAAGTCINNYELWSFPFDVQNLVVTFTISFYDNTQAYFILPNKPHIHILTHYTAIPGWDLMRTFGGIVNPSNFSTVVTVVQVRRRRTPYFLRLFVPLVMINLATFCMYSSKGKMVKLNILITCLLSFIGMIYVLSTNIPMAGDSTIFDQQAMGSIFLCTFVMFLVAWSKDESNSVFIAHLIIFVIIHVYIFYRMFICFHEARKKLHCNINDVTTNFSNKPLTYQHNKSD